jgi:hypothetical protein
MDGSYQLSKTKYAVNSSYAKKYKGYTLVAGPAIFLNPYAELEFTLGYSYSKFEWEEKQQTLASALGLQIHLGKGSRK